MKTGFVLRAWLIAALILAGLPARAARAATYTYTVDAIYDAGDSNLADHICYDGVGGCTLRAAVEQANALPAADLKTINFHDAGTYILANALGSLLITGSQITLDGGALEVQISGAALTSAPVIEVRGSQNHLLNLKVHHSPTDCVLVSALHGASHNVLENLTVYACTLGGIAIIGDTGSAGSGNEIRRSLIGASVLSAAGCPAAEATRQGIFVTGLISGTLVHDNTVVCALETGIYNGASGPALAPVGTNIYSNQIGVAGDLIRPNGIGIYDAYGVNTLISGNIVGGSTSHGINLFASIHTRLRSNAIGLNSDGTVLPNQGAGIYLDHAQDIHIGETAGGTGNFISGNVGDGVRVVNNTVEVYLDSNLIGLKPDGETPAPNNHSGVRIDNSDIIVIGSGTDIVPDQFISANSSSGVVAYDSSQVSVGANTVIGRTRLGLPAGNGGDGILLVGTRDATIRAGEIVNNGGAGIGVVNSVITQALRNTLMPGSVSNNAGLPLDLGVDGPTANGAHTPGGPNDWLAFPEFIGFENGRLHLRVCPNCSLLVYHSVADPRAAGGSLGKLADAAPGDSNGDVFLPATEAIRANQTMAFLTVDPTFNTSEASPRLTLHVTLLPLALVRR